MKSMRRLYPWILCGGLLLLLVGGGAAVRLAAKSNHGHPSPPPSSPPDPVLVYEAYNSTSNGVDLAVSDLNGNTAVVLPAGSTTGYTSPSWSPDGNAFVFAANLPQGPGIYVQDIDTTTDQPSGAPRLVTLLNLSYLPIAEPVWSPMAAADGQFKIAYTDDAENPDGTLGYHLLLVNTDGSGSPVDLTVGSGITGEVYPSWSPGADRIAVVSGETGDDVEVLTLAMVGGSLSVTSRTSLVKGTGSVLDGNGSYLGPIAWAKRSEMLAVVAVPPGAGNPDIYIIPVNSPATAYDLTNTPDPAETDPTWSPDDTQIIFWRWGQPTCGKHGGRGHAAVTISILNFDGSPFSDTGCTVDDIVTTSQTVSNLAHPDWRRQP